MLHDAYLVLYQMDDLLENNLKLLAITYKTALGGCDYPRRRNGRHSRSGMPLDGKASHLLFLLRYWGSAGLVLRGAFCD
jgi:hypothetical protein